MRLKKEKEIDIVLRQRPIHQSVKYQNSPHRVLYYGILFRLIYFN